MRSQRVAEFRRLLQRAHRHPRRRHGHDDPGLPPRRGGLPRRALQGLAARPQGQQRPADADAARRSSTAFTAQYLEAGADVIETNTFNSTAPSQADYGTRGAGPRAQSRGGAARAPRRRRGRRAKPAHRASSPACSARPTAPPRCRPTSTIRASATSASTSWWRPTAMPARALLEGGADLLLVETIFDTLNAKAALYAIARGDRCELARTCPIMVSGTITDASGRTLSGQTTEAFWNSVRHARPAHRRAELRARRTPAAAVRRGAGALADTYVCVLSERRPAQRVRRVRRDARGHWRRSSANSPPAVS